MRCPARRSTPASRSGRSWWTKALRSFRPVRGSWPTRTRPPSTTSACGSSRPSRRRSSSRRRACDPADRQLRLVHLQPRAPLRQARRGGGGPPQRCDRPGRGGAAPAVAARPLPRPGTACRRGRLCRDRPAVGPASTHPRRLPRPSGDRRGLRRRDRTGAAARARQSERDRPRRPWPLPRAPRVVRGRPLPFTRGNLGPRLPGDLGHVLRRRGDGRTPSRAAGGRRPVPPRVGLDAGRARARPELPGALAMTAQQALARLLDGHDLSRAEARTVMNEVMEGEATSAQIGGLLIALRLKGETADEIAGCAEAMRAHVLAVRPKRDDLVDTAGTGGDGMGTINISTAAALVAAAAGAGVAKHGNRAVSSASGSADVLEALGFELDLEPARIEQSIDELGFGFLFAPTHHPAMRHAAPVRRELATRTVFNVLGPLTNPAGARAQVVGVYSSSLVRTIAEVLVLLGARRAFVVHGAGGIDELSPAGPNLVCEVADGQIVERTIDPLELGVPRCRPEELAGGTPEENAQSVRDVLAGMPGPRRDAVLLNAAGAVAAAGEAADLREGLELARGAVDSGGASERLAALVAFSRQEVTTHA